MTTFSPLLIVIIIRIIYTIIIDAEKNSHVQRQGKIYANNILPLKKRNRMMKFLFGSKTAKAVNLFNGHYVDAKAFFVLQMNEVPCVSYIGELDMSKAFDFIMQNCKADIKHTYQHNWYDHDRKELFFNNTIIVLANNRMMELANNYCHLLHTAHDYAWANKMAHALAEFRMAEETAAYKTAKTTITGFARQTQLN